MYGVCILYADPENKSGPQMWYRLYLQYSAEALVGRRDVSLIFGLSVLELGEKQLIATRHQVNASGLPTSKNRRVQATAMKQTLRTICHIIKDNRERYWTVCNNARTCRQWVSSLALNSSWKSLSIICQSHSASHSRSSSPIFDK